MRVGCEAVNLLVQIISGHSDGAQLAMDSSGGRILPVQKVANSEKLQEHNSGWIKYRTRHRGYVFAHSTL